MTLPGNQAWGPAWKISTCWRQYQFCWLQSLQLCRSILLLQAHSKVEILLKRLQCIQCICMFERLLILFLPRPLVMQVASLRKYIRVYNIQAATPLMSKEELLYHIERHYSQLVRSLVPSDFTEKVYLLDKPNSLKRTCDCKLPIDQIVKLGHIFPQQSSLQIHIDFPSAYRYLFRIEVLEYSSLLICEKNCTIHIPG